MNQDAEHLRLLSIFHYVVGGITGLFACIPLIHVAFGLAMLLAPQLFRGNGAPPETVRQGLGVLFLVLGGVFVLAGWTIAVVIMTAGRSLASRKRFTFCQVGAALSCIVFPFGTVLGVLTLIVLGRPSVRAMFEPTPIAR